MPKERLVYKVHFNESVFICDVDATYHVDGNYGADADGNNGEARLFIDDVRVIEVRDEKKNIITWQALPIELKEKILKSVDEHL
jgi:hypothetical protein